MIVSSSETCRIFTLMSTAVSIGLMMDITHFYVAWTIFIFMTVLKIEKYSWRICFSWRILIIEFYSILNPREIKLFMQRSFVWEQKDFE